MDNVLDFLRTQTIAEFKADHLNQPIEVKESMNQHLLFFTCGTTQGWVSKKGIPSNPRISECKDPQGKTFFLLHEANDNNTPTVATL